MKRAALILAFLVLGVGAGLWAETPQLPGNTVFTALKQIAAQPQVFQGQYVSLKGTFEGWKGAEGRPPVTRSDWALRDEEGTTMYCTGKFPEGMRPDDPNSLGRKIHVLAKVSLTEDGKTYLIVTEALPFVEKPELMVSVAQILFDPIGMRGQRVSLLGVLAKGYGTRGNRFYLLADPSGAITLGRLPKLYPKGTILQLKGEVGMDDDGLPQLKNIEIIFAKP